MKRAKPAVRSSTIWGGVAAVVGAALPVVTEELARMPPSSATRWIGFGVAVVGGVLVVRGRAGEPAPVRGLFRTEGE